MQFMQFCRFANKVGSLWLYKDLNFKHSLEIRTLKLTKSSNFEISFLQVWTSFLKVLADF